MLGALPAIFAGLPAETQHAAASRLEPLQVDTGEPIMLEGEEDTTVAFVSTGTCEIWRGETKVGSAGPRDIIGEIELFGRMPRVCSITAATPVQLQALGPDAFADLAAEGNPIVHHLERAVLRRIGERLSRAEETLAQYARGQAVPRKPERTPSLLDRLTAPFRRPAPAPAVEPLEVLSASPVFSWLPREMLEELARSFQVVRFAAEERVCRQGEEGDRLFVVAEGSVEVQIEVAAGRVHSRGTLGAGLVFGDTALARTSLHTASVVTHDELVALAMDTATVAGLLGADDPAGSAFRQAIVRSLTLQLLPTLDQVVAVLSERASKEEELYKGTPVGMIWRD